MSPFNHNSLVRLTRAAPSRIPQEPLLSQCSLSSVSFGCPPLHLCLPMGTPDSWPRKPVIHWEEVLSGFQVETEYSWWPGVCSHLFLWIRIIVYSHRCCWSFYVDSCVFSYKKYLMWNILERRRRKGELAYLLLRLVKNYTWLTKLMPFEGGPSSSTDNLTLVPWNLHSQTLSFPGINGQSTCTHVSLKSGKGLHALKLIQSYHTSFHDKRAVVS